MDQSLIGLFLATFVTFFILIDAIGVTPIFVSLTKGYGNDFPRKMAFKSVFIASIIIFGFAFGGVWLFGAMHISLEAFKIAGGILLLLIAIDMVFEKRTERRESRAEGVLEGQSDTPEPDDVSVFPLGIPMIAGPGTIASAMFFMSEYDTVVEKAVILAALSANLLLTLGIFLAAGPLVRLFGDSFAGALTRIFGVILAALSIQMLIDGVKSAFGL